MILFRLNDIFLVSDYFMGHVIILSVGTYELVLPETFYRRHDETSNSLLPKGKASLFSTMLYVGHKLFPLFRCVPLFILLIYVHASVKFY
jgi:hypothetical protein